MTNRVVLGNRSGQQGLWISKPGRDVLTISADADFLFRTDIKGAQIVQSGIIPQTAGTFINVQIGIPDLGYRPVVELQSIGWYGVCVRYYSNSLIGIERATAQPGYSQGYWTVPPRGEAASRRVTYKVWSLPAL